MKLRLAVISKEVARGLRPVLRYIADNAPRKKDRLDAKSLLVEINEVRGTMDWKQITLTKGQEDILTSIYSVYDITAEDSDKQLKLL